MIALLLTPVAQHAHRLRLLVVVGDDDAALATGAEVLARIEAEAAGQADAAGARASIFSAVRLAGILDDGNAVALGDRRDRVHVGHLAVEMDGHDRLGPRRNALPRASPDPS